MLFTMPIASTLLGVLCFDAIGMMLSDKGQQSKAPMHTIPHRIVDSCLSFRTEARKTELKARPCLRNFNTLALAGFFMGSRFFSELAGSCTSPRPSLVAF